MSTLRSGFRITLGQARNPRLTQGLLPMLFTLIILRQLWWLDRLWIGLSSTPMACLSVISQVHQDQSLLLSFSAQGFPLRRGRSIKIHTPGDRLAWVRIRDFGLQRARPIRARSSCPPTLQLASKPHVYQ